MSGERTAPSSLQRKQALVTLSGDWFNRVSSSFNGSSLPTGGGTVESLNPDFWTDTNSNLASVANASRLARVQRAVGVGNAQIGQVNQQSAVVNQQITDFNQTEQTLITGLQGLPQLSPQVEQDWVNRTGTARVLQAQQSGQAREQFTLAQNASWNTYSQALETANGDRRVREQQARDT